MESRKLLQSDYLDILFDNRNKQYGGYELRKNYHKRLGRALLYLLLGISCLFATILLPSPRIKTIGSSKKPVVIVDILPPALPPVHPPVHPPQPVKPAASDATTTKIAIPRIDKDYKVNPDEVPPTKDQWKDANPGTSNHKGSGEPGIGNSGPGKGDSSLGTMPPPPVKPLKYAEVMPRFNGDLSAYLAAHLVYPDPAREAGVSGPVVVSFVFNEDGSVSQAHIVRGIGGGCDEEALRVVRTMPHWEPGRQNGTPVKVYFSLSIRFELE